MDNVADNIAKEQNRAKYRRIPLHVGMAFCMLVFHLALASNLDHQWRLEVHGGS